ncbi:uncharacterized protein LOC134728033 [Mytilus trossulus]|uniref:uncharacterized protein LOC134728033 n=1 Tax=Mytilus trossulus TaxID=6551 RepID=UPI003006A573
MIFTRFTSYSTPERTQTTSLSQGLRHHVQTGHNTAGLVEESELVATSSREWYIQRTRDRAFQNHYEDYGERFIYISATLEDVIDKIKSDVVHLASNKYSSFYNTSPDEKKAIQSLRNRDDIVIKPADKGSAVVIMDKANYIAEAVRQLSDERFYQKLDYDPTSKIITALQTIYNDGHIDEDTIGYLEPENAKPGRLYLLPKIHKVNNPGRPIVSANGHPTEKISEFVDFHLRSQVENLPSHIQDKTDYLRKMESMNPLPP